MRTNAITGLRSRALLFAALLVACAGAASCEPPSAASTPITSAARSRPPISITLLYTSDEHGWLLPLTDKGMVHGGAAEVLGQWIANEGHCPRSPIGTAFPSTSISASSAGAHSACADPATLLLSGGDNWTGPAISSFYGGLPMAEAMARMGYAASAFGNHDFDFGRDQFMTNRDRGGFPYLAANMHIRDERLSALDIKPYLFVERRGVKLGVIGLATDTTLTTALASRFEGIEISSEEPALDRAVTDAWSAGADALIVIAHECPDKLEQILARHPEWRLSFVGGGHCHRKITTTVGGTPIISPGWRLHSYARVRLTIDQDRPARDRVLSVEPEVVEVSHAEDAPAAAPPDEAIASMRSAWKEKLEKALGEPIGYSNVGIEQRSPEMVRWIAGAWRHAVGADIAIVNDGALRQALPRGPITKASVYSVMPFDNRLLVCSITGKDLLDNLSNTETLYSGLTHSPNGRFALSTGIPIEPGKKYSVVTIDYLYFGGAGFMFQKQDPKPKETGIDWRVPVIEWTKQQQSTPEEPIEQRLRP